MTVGMVRRPRLPAMTTRTRAPLPARQLAVSL
jgi:hypothetical protein